ncbi:MAG TPA: aldo/keto reductase [Burkholderiaceae bacterium]|nr:aldo/keto reductase [Burkholderiaceae bacterium]HQR75150.1 aldo/keto reductase [Burkholderiaceae bacterium]
MNTRRLGRSGLKVSELSFGSWVTYGNQVDTRAARELMAAAFDAGVNFFDNAEIYAKGDSEVIMGKVLKELGWPRIKYIVSTKFYWGMRTCANDNNTLNRKYLLDAIDGSLKRLQLDYVDLVYCHRADPHTPIEETVWAMHNIIERGKALYWGTSEWTADEIRAAWDIADRRNLHKPVMEQPQYNLLHRRRVEQEYARLYEDIGLGLTTWSPLASGLLSGKYQKGIPPGSRGALESYAFLREGLTDPAKNALVGRLEAVAKDLGCTLAQLALAWCVRNPRVSTVITGATRVEQVAENMKALDVVAKLTPEVITRIDGIVGDAAG